MMHDQGKRLAKVYPEAAVNELGAEPTLDREIQARIGDKLRSMYDELLEQPVPDRFKDLLDRLGQGGKE
jgi:Anti-sigma factor NepR